MAVIAFFRSPLGHAVRVVIGFALIVYGSILASLVGLVLMMVGMVPAVTGLVDMCLIGAGGRSCEVSESERERDARRARFGFRARTAHRGGSDV
jgi:hypothetical protein